VRPVGRQLRRLRVANGCVDIVVVGHGAGILRGKE
jgi:hypothetical protein